MRVYELTRLVVAGPLTIRLWIAAESGVCEECQEHADEVALLVSTLADEDDEPMVLADKISTIFATVTAVEVVTEDGCGGLIRER